MNGIKITRTLVLVCLTAFLQGGSAFAQSPGDRVRITETANVPFTGTVLTFNSDTLSVALGKDVRFLPIRDVRKLEVSLGQRRNTLRGLAIGALVGGIGAGLLFAYQVSQESCPGGCLVIITPSQAFLAGGILGGIGGGLLGTIIGTAVQTERWQRVDVGFRPGLTSGASGTVVMSLRL